MELIIIIIVLIVGAYFVTKSNGGEDELEPPRLFDIPISYLLSSPNKGFRCLECWSEYKEDIKVCPDCNKDIADFSELQKIWKFDYEYMDSVGHIYDRDELEKKLKKLKDDTDGALIVFFHLNVAYDAYFNEEIPYEKKKELIDKFMSIQNEIIN